MAPPAQSDLDAAGHLQQVLLDDARHRNPLLTWCAACDGARRAVDESPADHATANPCAAHAAYSRQARTLFGVLLVQDRLALARALLLELLERLLAPRDQQTVTLVFPLLHTVAAVWPDVLRPRETAAARRPSQLAACGPNDLLPLALEVVGQHLYTLSADRAWLDGQVGRDEVHACEVSPRCRCHGC